MSWNWRILDLLKLSVQTKSSMPCVDHLCTWHPKCFWVALTMPKWIYGLFLFLFIIYFLFFSIIFKKIFRSVGVILYECLFGKAPYKSESLEELVDKIKSEQPIGNSRFLSKISIFVQFFNFCPIFQFLSNILIFVRFFNFFFIFQFLSNFSIFVQFSILTILSRTIDWNFQSCLILIT